MISVVLHRLEREELIESRWIDSETERRRKYYRLKPAGESALKTEREEWLGVHRTLTGLWGVAGAAAPSAG